GAQAVKRLPMLARAGRNLMAFSKGLRGKFILLISTLLIATSMALGWIFLVREVRDEGSKLVQKGGLLIRNLAVDAELAVFTKNRESLAGLTQELIRDRDVAFVVVRDDRDEVLYSWARQGYRVPSIASLQAVLGSGSTADRGGNGEPHVFRD